MHSCQSCASSSTVKRSSRELLVLPKPSPRHDFCYPSGEHWLLVSVALCPSNLSFDRQDHNSRRTSPNGAIAWKSRRGQHPGRVNHIAGSNRMLDMSSGQHWNPGHRVLLTTYQDTTLWIHIFLQTFTFGILFPLGMVLGVSQRRSRGCHRHLEAKSRG